MTTTTVTEPRLAPGEQVFFRREVTQGFWWRKKIMEVILVTNKAIRSNNEILDFKKIHRIEIVGRHSRSRGNFTGYSEGWNKSKRIELCSK